MGFHSGTGHFRGRVIFWRITRILTKTFLISVENHAIPEALCPRGFYVLQHYRTLFMDFCFLKVNTNCDDNVEILNEREEETCCLCIHIKTYRNVIIIIFYFFYIESEK